MLTIPLPLLSFFFFFNDTATTEIYTLSLHDALPISDSAQRWVRVHHLGAEIHPGLHDWRKAISKPLQEVDRKSTRLNSSHLVISYAVFCLKKKKNKYKRAYKYINKNSEQVHYCSAQN